MKPRLLFYIIFTYYFAYQNSDLAGQGLVNFEPSAQKTELKCTPKFLETSLGECVGRFGSFYPFDIDNDGVMEIITTASINSQNTAGIWYILKYNAATLKYEQVYFKQYSERILYLNIIDLEDDGVYELVVVDYDKIHIVDLTTLNNIATIDYGINFFSYVMDLKYDDANSDGKKELILSSGGKLYLINPHDFKIFKAYNSFNGKFQVGNVDDDARTEIVFKNGLVIEIDPLTLAIKTEANFLPSQDQSSSRFFLQDVDGDGKKEAIMSSSSISGVGIFDIEKKKLKSTFAGNMDDLILYDVDQDGDLDAISTIDNFDEMIICVDILTNTELWRIDCPNNTNEAIAIGDFDNDSQLEIAWALSCDDILNDQIYIYDIASKTEEWTNEAINNKYYANTSGDIDGDGRIEYVVVRGQGLHDLTNTINIYDAETRELKFKSDPSLLAGITNPITNIQMYDYSQDGDMDIIIALSDNFRGAILVLDGVSYEIEKFKKYTNADPIEEFTASKIGDVNNDQIDELIIASKAYIYVYDLNSLEIKNIIPTNFFSNPGQDVLIGNIDDNPGNEIIVCSGLIYKLSNTELIKTSVGNYEYSCAYLFDWNKDGILDIVAGTNKGKLNIFDGDLNIFYTVEFDKDRVINGIKSGDIDGDGEEELIIAVDDALIFLKRDGSHTSRNELGYDLGKYSGLNISDTNDDGKDEVLVGNNIAVFVLNNACASCVSYDPKLEIINPKCNLVLGTIAPDLSNNSSVFFYQDSIMKDTLRNLDVGSYLITAVNENMCFKNFYVDLVQEDLGFKHEIESRDCFSDKLSDVSIHFRNGKSPYEYAWSTGSAADTLFDLPIGTYSVTITDSNGCINNETFEITDQTMKAFVYDPVASCIDKNNGNTSFYTTQGRAPFTFKWDDGTVLYNNFSLSSGLHSAMIKDANGCADTLYFEVPTSIVRLDAFLQSNDCSGKNNGAAKVKVLEGEAPFSFAWSTGKKTDQIINAISGLYTVTVTDNHSCKAIDTVIIGSSDIDVSSEIIDNACFGESNGIIKLTINEGIKPFKYVWLGTHDVTGIVSDLPAGEYSVYVIDSVNCGTYLEFKIGSPEEILIDFGLTPDDLNTNAPDGKIEAYISGGVSPYYIDWGNGLSENVLDSIFNGTYSVTVTDANNCLTVQTINLNTSGISLVKNTLIKLFPNPADTYITLENEGGLSFHDLKITDVLGRKFVTKGTSESSHSYQLDLSELTNGTYFISGKCGEYQFSKIFYVIR